MFQGVKDMLPQVRSQLAMQIHNAPDVILPRLQHFNYDPCEDHATVEEGALYGCMACGVQFRKHQRVAVPWLHVVGKGVLADSMGLGKTMSLAGLLAIMKETGELSHRRDIRAHSGRAVMVCGRASAIPQHKARLRGLLKGVSIEAVTGSQLVRQERVERYMQPWEVLIITQQTFVNDVEMLGQLGVNLVVADDLDALRHPDNKSAYEFKRFANSCDRVVVMSGTPLQKRLKELHSVLSCVGGLEEFGPIEAFVHRYIVIERVQTISRSGRPSYRKKEMGVKNMSELRRKTAPFALRRIPADVDDVDMPALVPASVYLDMTEAQARAYDQLKTGVRQIIARDGKKVTRARAAAAFMIGQQICSGLASLDAPDDSCKFDWIMDALEGDLAGEKVVVFVNFKKNIRALHKRLAEAGVGYVTIWGDEPDVDLRERDKQRFWSEPDIRVLIGTTAIEQSINLQCSRHLVYVDTILNPARMSQMAGRIRRDGSRHQTVYVHHLLCGGTQEERYEMQLRREQAIADALWEESSDQFESLSPMQMLQLITE